MAGVRLFGRRRPGYRRFCVIIELAYAGGRLADDRRDLLTAQINLPGTRQQGGSHAAGRRRASSGISRRPHRQVPETALKARARRHDSALVAGLGDG
jgi:hypothetical protein